MRRIVLILLLIVPSVRADDVRLEDFRHRLHSITFTAIPPPAPADFNPAAAKAFNITARSFQFDVLPSPLVVNRGDSVTLSITVPRSDPSTHGFFLDQHMTQALTISPGETKTVQFIANAPGRFFYFCTFFCGEGHALMGDSMMVNDALPAPAITSFTPTSGLPTGGTVVVITGTSFQNGLTVRFGDTLGIGTSVDSATRITTFTPVHAAGAVTISVTNPDGQSVNSSSQFTYVAPAAPRRRRAVKR